MYLRNNVTFSLVLLLCLLDFQLLNARGNRLYILCEAGIIFEKNNTPLLETPQINTVTPFKHLLSTNEGLGIGYQFEATNLLNKPLSVYTEFGISGFKSKFSKSEKILLGLDTSFVDGIFLHIFDVSYTSYNLNLGFRYKIHDLVDLSLGFSAEFIPEVTTYQIEKIIEPDDKGVFVNNTGDPNLDNRRIRNEFKQNIDNQEVIFYLEAGILFYPRFNFFSNELNFCLSYCYGFTPIVHKSNLQNSLLVIKALVTL